jgi:hypothetical protein
MIIDNTILERLDYRKNLIIDINNPILVQKAWRDRFSSEGHWKSGYGGVAYLSKEKSEDALTWNVFRSLQLSEGKSISSIYKHIFNINAIETILFWGCDLSNHNDYQIKLNSLIRFVDGRFRGTMTEPDLVLITKQEVVFIECKLNNNGQQSPWKAQSEGSRKRFEHYTSEYFPELSEIKDWENIYQLIRNYVYARLLAKVLNKKPLLVPIINEKHKTILSKYYQPMMDFDPIICQNLICWQEIDSYLNQTDFFELKKKMKLALL